MIMHDTQANEISLQGFQLVRGQMFSRQTEPAMTIWYGSASFNMACYAALNDCTSIQMLVNSDDRKILIRPCPSKDKDAVTWISDIATKKHKKLECSKLMHQLFDLWGLKKEYHYRANGKLVISDQKVMLMFDFSEPEAWYGLKMVTGLDN